jgi:hypothetical protein
MAGALLAVAVAVGDAVAALEVVRGQRSGGWLLYIAFLSLIPAGVSILFISGGISALRATSRFGGVLASSAVLVAAIVVSANSQWLQPDLHFRTHRCGGAVCVISRGSPGLPTWNAQRWGGLAVCVLALASIGAWLIAAKPWAQRLLLVSLVPVVLLTTRGSLEHAASSAAGTRTSCAEFLAHLEGYEGGPEGPDPSDDMVRSCRQPERFATSIGP